MQNLTEIKPVVVDPTITLEQLFEEFARLEDENHREAVREQILVKMRRRIKRLHDQARARYESEAGETPEATLKLLLEEPPAAVAAWIKQRPNLRRILDRDPEGAPPVLILISHHPDQVVSGTRGYGQAQKPEDFLDSFTAFVKGNINKIAALTVVLCSDPATSPARN